MARYSMRELKDKLNSGSSIRQLSLKDGLSKKIWLPIEDVVYKRTHFDIKSRTKFTRSTKSVLECCNQTPGAKGEGCPICEEIEELWKLWKATSGKDEKKKITERINAIVSEEFWFNGIDIDNPSEFIAIRFTPAMFREIDKIAEKYGLTNVTWIYKYSKDSNRYTLIENTDNKAKIDELKLSLDDLLNRDYENGGPCDIEKALIHPITRERMIEILNGDGSEGDYEEHIEDDKPAKSSLLDKKKAKESTAKVTEETTSLDELTLEDSPKDKKDELTLEDESLGSEDIGELGLDDLDLEEKPKMVNITFDVVSEKVSKKDVAYLKKLAAYFIEEKKIEKKEAINDQIRELASFVKKSGSIEVPESKLL